MATIMGIMIGSLPGTAFVAFVETILSDGGGGKILGLLVRDTSALG
jgi:hypothetical protein